MLNLPLRKDRTDTLDVLRAVLAIWVMFAHVLPWSVYYVGAGAAPELLRSAGHQVEVFFQAAGETHPAVLMFIVLSGYCIHRSGLRPDRFELKSYAVRRFFRIYPVFLLAVVAGIVGWLISTQLNQDPSRTIAGTTSIEPWCVLAKATGAVAVYPEVHRCSFAGNAPLNTVIAEMYLYAAYPLLLALGFVVGARKMAAVIAAISISGMIAVFFMPELRHWWNSASLPGFLLYWWIGALALEPKAARWMFRLLPLWLIVFGCLSWLVLSEIDRSIFVAEGRKVMLALIAAALIAKLDRPLKVWGPITVFGKAGYSIYAFHGPVTTLVLVAGGSWIAAILSGLAVGIIGWFVVERPFMSLGKSLALKVSQPHKIAVNSATPIS